MPSSAPALAILISGLWLAMSSGPVAPPPLAAQSVAGRVLDPEAGTPLSGVSLRLLDDRDRTGIATLSSDSGHFHLTAPRAGAWRIDARLLGYGGVTSAPLDLSADDTVAVEIRMAVAPVIIEEPVIVLGSRSSRSPVLTSFDRRRRWGERTGFGRFIYGRALELRSAGRATDLLRGIAGVRVSGGDVGSGQIVQMRGGCVPAIFVDGSQINLGGQGTGFGQMESLDSYVDVGSIQGIEVYHGAYQPGGPYVDRSGCGLVLVWTKRGEYDPDARFSWVRLLIGMGLVLGVVLLGR